MNNTPLQFAKDITNEVNRLSFAELLDRVTPTTRNLLSYWFDERFCETRNNNYHEGQKQAILNIIYIHEVLKCKNIIEAYQHFSSDILLSDLGLEAVAKEKYSYPKYAIKMATGTGKTWVLSALLIWQYLNAKYNEQGNYSKNFLIVAPGLIVYDRLLDAFLGREEEKIVQTGIEGSKLMEAKRVFETSDIFAQQELFLPQEYREEVFGFVQSCTKSKDDINNVTGEGLIAITNWHLLTKEEESPTIKYLPVRPGASAGNDLNALDSKYGQDKELFYLRDLKDLVVFNDEAHHIHEVKKKGELNEVEWQRSLDIIAKPKGEQFIQIDFSATPYNQVGKENRYFPHIIVDFDLKTAILKGLVKTIVLDQRKEVAALPLEFNAERDENGNVISLSEGQRVMLRAGVEKLDMLEKAFKELEDNKHPKMLIMCEDTNVAPKIHEFLLSEGIPADDILEIHSNRKGEMSDDEWKEVKYKLFHIDKHASPRIIISVLMLREGFDVNNICVIVPLRSSASNILLEQTIGRGLRLMWREPTYIEHKEENRKALLRKEPPPTYIDLLSIIEHPAFIQFYKQFIEDGLVGIDTEDIENKTKEGLTGDMIRVPLRSDYKQYDFKFPIVIKEAEEILKDKKLVATDLSPIQNFTFQQLKAMIPKGDTFISEELTKGTRFGDYSVQGGIMTASSYNDYIARLVTRIASLLSEPLAHKHDKNKTKYPAMQVKMPMIAELADSYIRTRLFEQPYHPFEDENWRLLLVPYISEHIIKEISKAVVSLQETDTTDNAEVLLRPVSEISSLQIRENFSISTSKTIYEKTPFPCNKGGLEKAFIEYADTDTSVSSFVKLMPHLHYFIRLRYMKEDGLTAYYYPDFLVRCNNAIYMVETKAQDQLSHPNVRRKQVAALNWTSQINNLPEHLREGYTWQYVLLGEDTFYSWKNKLASMVDILEFSKLRESVVTGKLL